MRKHFDLIAVKRNTGCLALVISFFAFQAFAGRGIESPPWHLMREFTATPIEQRVDRELPTAPQIALRSIWRGWGLLDNDSTWAFYLGQGAVQLTVSGARDNRTSSEALGYRFEFIDGAFPDSRTISTTAYKALPGGVIYLVWNDGATWAQDRFAFRMAVRAIDAAGNESALSNIVIVSHDGNMHDLRKHAVASHARFYSDEAIKRVSLYKPLVGVDDAESSSMPTMNPVRVEATPVYGLEPPSNIYEVYDSSVVVELGREIGGRVDRFKRVDTSGTMSNEEIVPGRKLSTSERQQLQSLLLDPATYILDKYACILSGEYQFTLGSGKDELRIIVGSSCHQLSISGRGERASSALTHEAAVLLRGFCESLFVFDRIDD